VISADEALERILDTSRYAEIHLLRTCLLEIARGSKRDPPPWIPARAKDDPRLYVWLEVLARAETIAIARERREAHGA
jgi:hypothetical protein